MNSYLFNTNSRQDSWWTGQEKVKAPACTRHTRYQINKRVLDESERASISVLRSTAGRLIDRFEINKAQTASRRESWCPEAGELVILLQTTGENRAEES